jgi:transcriptional regulator with XRE-family HTH domain
MAHADFPARLQLAMKALSISRGRLAAELALDKSVISRWLAGRHTPSGENLVNLTALVEARRPGFSLLDWESDFETLATKLTVAGPPPGPWGPLGGWLPDSVLEEARDLTDRRGDAYEGFWRTTRPAISQPDRFIHDRLMIRRADNGFLTFRLGVEDMRFEGWTFPTQTQLFSIGADARTGIFIFTIFNAVLRSRAEVMDGLALTMQRIGGGSPMATGALMERTGALSGDPAADDGAYEASIQADPFAPEGSIPEHVRKRLLPDIGPSAMVAGGQALLHMAFANSLSRGPLAGEPT